MNEGKINSIIPQDENKKNTSNTVLPQINSITSKTKSKGLLSYCFLCFSSRLALMLMLPNHPLGIAPVVKLVILYVLNYTVR